MSRKLVEITTKDGKTYHEDFEEAAVIAKNNPHHWEGMRKLVLTAEDRKDVLEPKVTWAPRPSGPYLVLQVISR